MPSIPTPEASDAEFDHKAYRLAASSTLSSIHQAVSSAELTFLSNRPIAEIEALQQEIADVIPAGNIVGLVLGGLVRLRGRSLPANQAKSDIKALLRGMEILPRNILSGTLYSAFMAGPATVLTAYQKILTLTGKNLESAFPEGLWQFYLEFAMREDSARHANESLGFQQALRDYDLNVSEIDQLAAWVCAVSQICFQYDALLDNEWREQTYLNLLVKMAEEVGEENKLHFQKLHRAWATQCPYHRGKDVKPDETYIRYRRRRFDNFFQNRLRFLSDEQQKQLQTNYEQLRRQELDNYQRQMTILATLDPERYRENRVPIPLWQAKIGIILAGRYYLLPVCYTDQTGQPLMFESEQAAAHLALHPDPRGHLRDQTGRLVSINRSGQVYDSNEQRLLGSLRPASFQAIRRQVAAIFNQIRSPQPQIDAVELPALDEQLVHIKRENQERVRKLLKDRAVKRQLQALKYAPVIINWDEQDNHKPLTQIRSDRRGIGDHVLTIFRTPTSMVFDQSHIFFDGVWGIALSEILTGEAISWAAYFGSLPAPEPAHEPPYSLKLAHEPALDKFTDETFEVSAENTAIKIRSLYALIKLLPQRRRDLKLTVNDLLIFYRGEFCHEYKPSPQLTRRFLELQSDPNPQAQQAYHLINEAIVKAQTANPAILIPMSATAASPYERLYHTTFRNPFTELWGSYQQAWKALRRYTVSQTQTHWIVFSEARNSLLVQLDYLGQLFLAYKRVALAGGSPSTATLKLLAHVPHSVLKLLDEIPQRVDVLNEVIKGEEVFSNVGRVARGASLSRFISAKDDNPNKTLVWGALTDDKDTMHLSLRDFRPHVAQLHRLGRADLAEMIIEDYLDSFIIGFNQFVDFLLDIIRANATHASKKGGAASKEGGL